MKKIIYVFSFLIFCLWGQSQNNQKGFSSKEKEIFRVKPQAQRWSLPITVNVNTTDLPHNPPLIAESSLEFVGNTKAAIINFLKSKNQTYTLDDLDDAGRIDDRETISSDGGFLVKLWKDNNALDRIVIIKEKPDIDYLLSKKFQLMPGALFPDHLYKWTPTENIPYRFYYSNNKGPDDFKTKQQMQGIDKKTLAGTFVFYPVSDEGFFGDSSLYIQVKNGIIQRIDYGSSE